MREAPTSRGISHRRSPALTAAEGRLQNNTPQVSKARRWTGKRRRTEKSRVILGIFPCFRKIFADAMSCRATEMKHSAFHTARVRTTSSSLQWHFSSNEVKGLEIFPHFSKAKILGSAEFVWKIYRKEQSWSSSLKAVCLNFTRDRNLFQLSDSKLIFHFSLNSKMLQFCRQTFLYQTSF